MIEDLKYGFSTIEGLYTSMKEACEMHCITEDVGISKNLKQLFKYLSCEIFEEIKKITTLTDKIIATKQSISESDQKKVLDGFKIVKAVFDNYGWIIKKFKTGFATDNLKKSIPTSALN